MFELRRAYHVDDWIDDTVDELEQDDEVTKSLIHAGEAAADTDDGDNSEWQVGHHDAYHQETDRDGCFLVQQEFLLSLWIRRQFDSFNALFSDEVVDDDVEDGGDEEREDGADHGHDDHHVTLHPLRGESSCVTQECCDDPQTKTGCPSFPRLVLISPGEAVIKQWL